MHAIRVFISSPSDVSEERAALRKILADLPYDPFLRGKVAIEEVSWDRPNAEVPLLASLTPQEAVNRGLPRPSDCDIVVVLLWSRLGTPPGAEHRRPDGGPIRSGTEWEYYDAVEAERATGRPKILLYRRTSDVVVSLKDPELVAKQHQLDLVEEFLTLLRDRDGSGPGGINAYADVLQFGALIESHLRSVVKELMDERIAMDSGQASNPSPSALPFPGLRPFHEDESLVFFGREHETSELIQRLGDPKHRFLAVIGSSGVGKSSLVRAGVIPALRAGAIPGSDAWATLRFTPGEMEGGPFAVLATRLSTALAAKRPSASEEIASGFAGDPGRLDEYVRLLLADSPPWSRLLMVIDQFEELFSSTVTEADRARFVALIAEAVRGERVVVIATLRADFYAHCLQHPDLAALLRTGSFPLGPAGSGALFRMITRPAEIAGLRFEDQLAERILDDVGAEPGSLALMAFALNSVAQRASEQGALLVSEYERIGGIQGAVATRAEEIFDHLPEADREQLPTLFRKLTDVSEADAPVRRRARLGSLTQTAAARRLIQTLTEARLVVVSGNAHSEPTVEVAHEALFDSWPRLADWIQQTQDDLTLLRQLRRAAQDWERAGRPDSFLWPHERLVSVEAMLTNLDADLDDVIEAFIVPEATRILAEVAGPCTHQRRASLGDRLADIGDPRRGLGLDAEGFPDLLWQDVPGGRVELRGAGEVDVPAFQIAAYPVTYAQYLAFVRDPQGFADPRWFDGLAVRPQEPGSQFRKVANHPAENVSWFDAVAFCRWLGAHLGTEVRLPTDWEWQLAAAGPGDGAGYSWGEGWAEDRANTLECGLGRTLAVGLYGPGASPDGVHDLHGNVWEWCLNQLSERAIADIDYGSSGARVVRGGSWLVAMSFARSGFRGWDDPELRYPALGFRVLRSATS